MAIESEALLTVQEVARRLHLHPITVRRMIKAGRLPIVRLGRSVRVREADVNGLIRNEAKPAVKLPYRWPPTAEEIERRTKLMEEMFARRDARAPLGISTTELVREARRELEERYDRGTRPRRRRVGGR